MGVMQTPHLGVFLVVRPVVQLHEPVRCLVCGGPGGEGDLHQPGTVRPRQLLQLLPRLLCPEVSTVQPGPLVADCLVTPEVVARPDVFVGH